MEVPAPPNFVFEHEARRPAAAARRKGAYFMNEDR
jgi:hypothetical protein